MTRTLVESSNVASVGYDPERELLEVEFVVKDGKPPSVYQYQPVRPEIYAEMLAPGASVGKLLNQRVKCDPAIAATKIDEVLS